MHQPCHACRPRRFCRATHGEHVVFDEHAGYSSAPPPLWPYLAVSLRRVHFFAHRVFGHYSLRVRVAMHAGDISSTAQKRTKTSPLGRKKRPLFILY
jgi:hypothetical protein